MLSGQHRNSRKPAFFFPSRLSGRLLLLTVVFVMLAEVLIYVPSIANFRFNWLQDKLAVAQIASLAVEAHEREGLSKPLEVELLKNAGVLQVALRRDATRILMLSSDNIPMADSTFDLRTAGRRQLILNAFGTLFAPEGRVIIVRGLPAQEGGELIEVMLYNTQLKRDMLDYSRNILLLSIAISVLSAILVFISLNRLFVAPMKNLTQSMMAFRQQPEDPSRVLKPNSSIYEIRLAEEELSDMQAQIRAALHQKTRLAALGTAVSKINHDLRNILASAQLVSDMLASSDDPKVQRLVPRLVGSINRAVELAARTLKFGKAEEPSPQKELVDFHQLAAEIRDHVGLTDADALMWKVEAPADLKLYGDPDHLFRVLMNLCRNAVEAVSSVQSNERERTVLLRGRKSGAGAGPTDGGVTVDVIDNGPGIPDKVKETLFTPFAGSSNAGSIGLGLVIAKELIEANGGKLYLVKSNAAGTHFQFTLPNFEA